MKFAAALLSVALAFGASNVSRALLESVEKTFDKRLKQVNPDDPFALLLDTQGVYLNGYGVLFTAQVSLYPVPGLAGFGAPVETLKANIHKKKLERLPNLRREMREMMVAGAGMLDTVPADEQLALAVSLTRKPWEDMTGLPNQIVMQASRRALVEFQTAKRDPATLDQVIKVQEF